MDPVDDARGDALLEPGEVGVAIDERGGGRLHLGAAQASDRGRIAAIGIGGELEAMHGQRATGPERICRRYVARGRVQGVGYRAFVAQVAKQTGVSGWVRNLDDGSVESVAVGTADVLAEFAGHLHRGPRWSDVRGVDECEHALIKSKGFSIKY